MKSIIFVKRRFISAFNFSTGLVLKRAKLLSVVLLMAGFSYGQGNMSQKPPREKLSAEEMIQKRIEKMNEKLDLSQAQVSKRVSRKRHLVEIRKLRQAHRNLRETYIRMAMSPDYNSQRADSLFSEMAKINGEMQRSTWNHFRNIYEICNDQQRKEFRRFMLRMNKLQDRVKRPAL